MTSSQAAHWPQHLDRASNWMLGRGRVSVLLSRSITRSPDRTDRAMEKVREESARKIYIPLAQVGPSQPGGHWHSNPVGTSWHVPPFAQGLDTQACSAAKTQWYVPLILTDISHIRHTNWHSFNHPALGEKYYLSIHLFMHPLIHPSIHPFIYLSILASIYPSLYLPIH